MNINRLYAAPCDGIKGDVWRIVAYEPPLRETRCRSECWRHYTRIGAPVSDIVPRGFDLTVASRHLREVALLRETFPQTQSISTTDTRTSLVPTVIPLQASPAALHGPLGVVVGASKTAAVRRRNT